jgi:uncharacterized protein YjbJ (UPF0337 family)
VCGWRTRGEAPAAGGRLVDIEQAAGDKSTMFVREGDIMKPSTTDQIQGAVHEVKGKLKEKAGQVTGNPDLTDEGQAEQLVGKVQKKIGEVEKVVAK